MFLHGVTWNANIYTVQRITYEPFKLPHSTSVRFMSLFFFQQDARKAVCDTSLTQVSQCKKQKAVGFCLVDTMSYALCITHDLVITFFFL